MAIIRHDSAAAFLAATEDFRAEDPLLTNIMGSVASGVLGGRVYESELWLTVHDDAGLIGMAMRTAPWNLSVSAMPTAAAEDLGRFVAQVDADVPGVTGPRDAVASVITGLAPGAGRLPRTDMVDVLRVLTTLHPPIGVPGAARGARVDDVALLVDWHHAFADDAGLAAHGIEESVASQVDQRALWIWEDSGAPVSMAGHAPLVPTPTGVVGRIGPVYTPLALRGRGYGSAVTAAVAMTLLPRCSTIMLFADAAKPEINRMYERLGFEESARIVEVRLDA